MRCPIWEACQRNGGNLALSNWSYKDLNLYIQKISAELFPFEEQILAFVPTKTLESIALFFAAWRFGKTVYPLSTHLPEEKICEKAQKVGARLIRSEELLVGKPAPFLGEIPPNAGTMIETSSGTKIACHTLGQHLISAHSANEALGLKECDAYLLNLPLYHVSGLATILRTFAAKAQLLLEEKQIDATHISMVPTQLYRQLHTPSPLPKLKCLLVGGGPLSESLKEEVLLRGLPVVTTYGMTEIASMALIKRRDEKIEILKHVEVKLAADGEILLKSASLLSNYWGKPPIGEWFATGDLGAVDHAGDLRIVGRKDRQFISGGENIQPEIIEQALLEVKGVYEARVEAKEDEEFGQLPLATIFCDEHLTNEAICEQLQGKLPKFAIPKTWKRRFTSLDGKFSKLSEQSIGDRQ